MTPKQLTSILSTIRSEFGKEQFNLRLTLIDHQVLFGRPYITTKLPDVIGIYQAHDQDDERKGVTFVDIGAVLTIQGERARSMDDNS